MAIETTHLQLLPYSPAHLLALLEGVQQFEEQIGLRAADGLRNFGSDDVSPAWLARLRASTAADPWVHGFAVVDRESCSVIGSATFKGSPDEEGAVEIAYGIVAGYQGRGYATEAATSLVTFAFDSPQVRLIRAHTLPTNSPSIRVLEKCGFARIGEVVDPDDGLVLRWERSR